MEEPEAGGPFVSGSLFAYLEPADRQFLLDRGVRRTFPQDDLLIRQGDPTNHVFIILSGWVRVSEQLVSGSEVLRGLRGPGDILGDEVALQRWVRPSSVRTLHNTVDAVQLLADDLQSSLQERPALAVALIKNLQVRIREVELVNEELGTLDVTRRVASYLVYLASRHGENKPDGITLRIPLTQQDIANRVRASRRAVARALAGLRDRRIVTVRRQQLVINQPDMLRQLAGQESTWP